VRQAERISRFARDDYECQETNRESCRHRNRGYSAQERSRATFRVQEKPQNASRKRPATNFRDDSPWRDGNSETNAERFESRRGASRNWGRWTFENRNLERRDLATLEAPRSRRCDATFTSRSPEDPITSNGILGILTFPFENVD